MTIDIDLGTRRPIGSDSSDLTVLIGEIHTGVLQNSLPITTETAAELLALAVHQTVRTWERPVRHAASPEILSGVDCQLPAASGGRRRAVGTIAAEARVTAGRVLQVTAWSRCVPAAERRRLRWSHYVARPATVEVLGDLRPADLIDGFLQQRARPGTLDLSGVCAGLFGQVQSSPVLDRTTPFRMARTRLRWSATPTTGSDPGSIQLTIGPEGDRTLQVTAPMPVLDQVETLCQDIALHDWLLTSLIAIIDLANVGGRDRVEVVRHLRPAVDNLLHVWMPAARLPAELVPFWAEVERMSGYSRQWEALVRRIRDQLALAVLEREARSPRLEVDVRTTAPEVASS
jgi:hypothetical protein